MAVLFSLSIALFAGLMLSRLAKLVQLPAVTAYLVAGVIIGPFCLGLFNVQGLGFTASDINNKSFSLISDIALGFIAFSIGNEFRLSQLKTIGKSATIIGILQAVITTIFVDFALIALHFIMPDKLSLEVAIILGAVASATAPAATLMVVRQYKAKGPVTDTLLPVVALDDAVGLVLFSVSFGVAKGIMSGTVNVLSIVVEPLVEVIISIGLGAGMGYLFTFFERFFHSRSKRLSMSVAFVLLTVAVSMLKFDVLGIHIAFSPLLSCMMLGTIFCNICDFSEELMDRLDRWTAPIFILFFVLSGAELDLTVFTDIMIVLIGVVYIVFRCLGKYFGANWSSKMAKAPANVTKYLGITLFPQAGVALGMAIKVMEYCNVYATTNPQIAQAGIIVQNIILFSVLIYELVGPFLTKIALTKAGEVDPEGKVSARKKDEKLVQEDQTKSA
ncbi:MAG: cation:proton antiporter [Clostridia bacterium]|nr:cation:proton antiporter [Clostridia bacterium]